MLEGRAGRDGGNLNETRRMLKLIFRIPLAEDTPDSTRELILEAQGTVEADLRVLEKRRSIQREITEETSPTSLALAIADVHQAAQLRSKDGTLAPETLDHHRRIVLDGLQKLLQISLFNEGVGHNPDQGIAIVQFGFGPKQVEGAIGDVQEAAEVRRQILEEPEIIFAAPIPPVIATPGKPTQPPEPEIIEVSPTQPETYPPRRSRRFFISRGTAQAATVVTILALGIHQSIRSFNLLRPLAAEPSTAQDFNTLRTEENFVKSFSLSEEPTLMGRNLYAFYPPESEGVEYEDIFGGDFKHNISQNLSTPYIPIFVKRVEGNPVFQEFLDTYANIYYSTFRPPMTQLNYGVNFNFKTILSGKKAPLSEEQRRYPNIVGFYSSRTQPKDAKDPKLLSNSIYLEITPVFVGRGFWGEPLWENQIRYMRRVEN